MLTSTICKQIREFVQTKPRTVHEIAQMLGKNWRTADRYVAKIAQEQGTLATRTFRGGTRGALKIVYWNNLETVHATGVQERLFSKINQGRTKHDFSPFDIYQHIEHDKRRASLRAHGDERCILDKDLFPFLKSAQHQILFFSGNLSWVNIEHDGEGLMSVLEALAKNIPVKVITKIDITSHKNLARLMKINEALGREAIEVRHCEQPLRGIVIDGRLARFREVKHTQDYKKGELDENTYIYYEIYDHEWVAWLEKVFWKLFRTGNLAKKRVESLSSIENLY